MNNAGLSPEVSIRTMTADVHTVNEPIMGIIIPVATARHHRKNRKSGIVKSRKGYECNSQ